MISGRVQGVGFRYFAQAAAGRENIHGWVRNLPDGRVEASAEGEADAVQRFEQALRHGPRGARVEQLEIEHTVPSGRDPASPFMTMTDLKTQIRHVPDFPKAGILFYDITTLLQDPAGLRAAIDSIAMPFKDQQIDLVVGIESRGFIFGAPVADRLGAGFAPVRKPGKLPSTCVSQSYALEYGTDTLEIHADAVKKGQRVLIVDDLLATGGTARAAADLVKKIGGTVHALAFLIELVALNGRAKLAGETLHTSLQY